MALAQLVSVGLAIWLTLRIHAAASYRLALSLLRLSASSALRALYFTQAWPTSRWFLAVAIVAGLGRGALNYIPWSVYNYMPDVDEIVTGPAARRRIRGRHDFHPQADAVRAWYSRSARSSMRAASFAA